MSSASSRSLVVVARILRAALRPVVDALAGGGALIAFLAFLAFAVLMAFEARAAGPGLGNVAWSADQVFEPVGHIESAHGHGNVTMVNGYLLVIVSSDGGGNADNGAIELWDVSNPAAPSLAGRIDDDDTHGLREAHGFSLAWMPVAGVERLVLAAQGEEGVSLWDVSDAPAIERLAFLDLPGIAQGDYSGDWWLFWQAPWLYVAGVDSGLSIVDASDVENPVLVRQMTTGELAGVSPSQAVALGNLLVLMESQSRAFVTLDVARPDAPRVLRRLDGKPGYSHIFAADGKIFTSGNIPPRMHVHQVSADGDIDFVATHGLYFNSGGYGSYQDGAFHSGFSDRYVKFDATTGDELGTGTSGRSDRDEDFAVVLGNLVFAGDDHGEGTALIPHQSAPDTAPPVVEWMHPPAGATGVALTSRIGLSLSDHVDAASLAAATVTLVDGAGQVVPARLSQQMGLVNVAPVEPLAPLTTYTVVAEGVRDLAGNASARFEATLTTGDGNDVVVDPAQLVPAVDSNSPFGAYAVGAFAEGAATYVDRDFAFLAGYPARFEGQPYVQTRNNDKLGFSADFLRFTLASPAEVHVLYDVRADQAPDWLDAFTPTGEQVANDDTTYDVYARAFPAGDVVLGGNAASGSAGTESMYSVVVVTEPVGCELALAPALEGSVALAVQGAPADARFDWQVGDGVLEDAGASPSVTLAAGRHSVVVTVTSGPQVATCSAVQIVHRPLLPVEERARTSEGVAWLAATGGAADPLRVVAVNADNGTVTAVEVASAGVTRVLWETDVGGEPVAVSEAPGGRLHVLDREGARIVELDASGGDVVRSRALPRASRPEALVVADDGTAWVTLGALGEVVRIDGPTGVESRAFVVDTARGLTFAPGAGQAGDGTPSDGTLWISRRLSPDTHGEVVGVDARSLEVVHTIELAYDAGPDTEATGAGVPNQLSPLRISADGARAYVSATKANIGRGLYRDERALTFESRVRAMVATIDMTAPGGPAEIVELRRDINDRDMVQANALSLHGDLLFVASQGGNFLDVFENEPFDPLDETPPSPSGRRVSQIATGRAPQGVAVVAEDDLGLPRLVAVQNALDRTLSIFDARELLEGRANHLAPIATVRTVESERLDAVVLRGKQLFHDASDRRIAKDGYVSCASCHLDGGHDGRTWDFTQAGEGLRNTIALRGRAGVERMGRVHWTANFDEVQDFEHDIRNAFGGTGLLTDEDFAATSDPLGAPKAGRSADLDALAAYVTSLDRVPPSPHRDASGKLTAEARRGRVVFLAQGCNACHTGAVFTDLAKHDVGTIGDGSGLGIGAPLDGAGFDTPTLLGVWDTAPYFHDGSAATLDDVLTRHGGTDGAASTTSVITAAERADLVAYLLQIDEDASAPEEECSVRDECVRVDDPDAPGIADPAVPGDLPGARGCGCGASSAADAIAWGGALAMLAMLRTRRRRGASSESWPFLAELWRGRR